jgi:hypothetical protein
MLAHGMHRLGQVDTAPASNSYTGTVSVKLSSKPLLYRHYRAHNCSTEWYWLMRATNPMH